MGILRDLMRRKSRTILTIFGIAIGVFALVVLGAASENNNVYSVKLTAFYRSVITIADKDDMNFFGMANGARPLSMAKLREIEAYPGVARAFPQIGILLSDTYMSVIPPMILSVAPGMETFQDTRIVQGNGLHPGQRGEALLGSDLAKQMQAKVGDMIKLRGHRFEVVGVLDRTFINLSDSSAYVGIEDARALYIETLPKAFQSKVRADDLAVGVTAYARKGVNPNTLSADLERDIVGIATTGPTEMMDKVNGLVGLLNAVVAAIAVLALLIGGLSIVNTMLMSISERGREIGLKRALGASKWRIVREVLSEAALIAGIGGILGIVFGTAAAVALNSALLKATGTSAFLVTWRLAVAAFLFSLVLGVIGGLYPARRASRVDPAIALAYE